MIALILIIVIGVVIYFGMIKNKPTKNAEENILVNDMVLDANVAFFRGLNKTDKTRFENEVKEFLKEVTITGVNTPVSDTDKILVASSAVIPVFAFPGSKYPNLREVLIYADAINMDFQSEGNTNRDILGMVGTGYMEGKMLLSKPALQAGFSNRTDKRNTGIHEFVHLIDKSDGETDGVPELLLDKQYVLPWLDLIHTEMEKIKEGGSDIDVYGYTNKSEFFAVAAEYFFERPDLFKENHPQLFGMMEKIFTPALAK
jgi:Mlc titration factor MtfA (ptsG expression regulator)